MIILLIERDPFIRIDITEALQKAYPAAAILDGEEDAWVTAGVPTLIMVDRPPTDAFDPSVVDHWQSAKIPIIVTDAPEQPDADASNALIRPFNDQMLTFAVQQALAMRSVEI